MAWALRPANPADAGIVAPLVVASDSGFLTGLFGPRTEELFGLMLRWTRNHFSVRHVTVACKNGAVHGMVLGYPFAALRSEAAGTAAALAWFYGPRLFALLPGLLSAARVTRSLLPSDWYVSNLAVARDYRGRGAGSLLLESFCRRARDSGGARAVALDVDETNADAERFYRGVGFGVRERILAAAGGQTFAFIRLELAV